MLWQPALPDRYKTMSDSDLHAAIEARRAQLGDDLLILGHHYQQDAVIQHADLTGDSLKLSQMAADEATLQGRDYGLEVLRSGYRFVEYDPFANRWGEIVGDEMLRHRQLPGDLEFDLYVEDRRIQLSEQTAQTQSDDSDSDQVRVEVYAPHALLLSSGDLSPFSLTLTRPADDVSIQVRVMPNGDVRIGKEDADFE